MHRGITVKNILVRMMLGKSGQPNSIAAITGKPAAGTYGLKNLSRGALGVRKRPKNCYHQVITW
jgi:hypothetical protein